MHAGTTEHLPGAIPPMLGDAVRRGGEELGKPSTFLLWQCEQGPLAVALFALSLVCFPAFALPHPEGGDIQDALSPCIAGGLCEVLILDAQCPQSLCHGFRVGLGHSLSCGALMVAPLLRWHSPGGALAVGEGLPLPRRGNFVGRVEGKERNMLEMGKR